MTNLNITERRNDTIIILDLNGRIIFGESSEKLHKALRLSVERGERKILLNLAGVSHIDSSGLGELVGGCVAAKRIEGEIKLLHLSPNVRDLVNLTNLFKVFDIYESEAEAVKSFYKQASKSASIERSSQLF